MAENVQVSNAEQAPESAMGVEGFFEALDTQVNGAVLDLERLYLLADACSLLLCFNKSSASISLSSRFTWCVSKIFTKTSNLLR